MGGMAFLLLAAAAKRQRDQQMASARRRRRESEEARKKREESSHWYSSSEPSKKSFMDCIMEEMMYGEDEELVTFALRLDECCKEAKAKKGAEYVEEAEKCMDYINECNEKRNKLIEEIEQMGVTINEDRENYRSFHYVDLNAFSYKDADGHVISLLKSHDGKNTVTSFTEATGFNGIHLSIDMLQDPNNSKYKKAYENEVKYNEGVREEREALITEIEKKEKRLKFTIFNREKKEDDLKELKRRLVVIDGRIKDEEEAKRRYEIFQSFTPEQKSKILQYLYLTQGMSKATNMVRKYGSEFKEKATVSYYEYDKETIEKGVEHMAEKYGLSEEDVCKIFDKLNKFAIRRNRGEYEDTHHSITYSRFSEYSDRYKSVRGVMHGFVRHVYEADEKFVEDNIEDAIIEEYE